MEIMLLVMGRQRKKNVIEALYRGTSNIKNSHMLVKIVFLVYDEQDMKELVLYYNERNKFMMLGHFRIPLVLRFL